ncbi:hypothetical protein D9Q98_003484 [Chlorella vulgaris]|uniref:C2 NT-type domain-containing protein n=1 Tax=Chlorella vulgaris TaxID=3077 RepID=A0A9D4TU34_CHLVU|nr:hypothetical protein D9Q98_003484 [Chlorella vulgaris]
MGIFKKHQGKGVRLTFSLHIHTLSWPIGAGSLCVRFERGSHKGSTRAVEPAVKGGHAIYAFEEQLTLPATLFQDVTASKRRASGGLGPFEPKLLQLSVVPDSRSGAAKHTGQPVGSVSLNLADFARADGGLQDELVLAGPGGSTLVTPSGPPKLLVTIRCRDAKGGGPELALEPSASSWVQGGLPTRLSTDADASRQTGQANSGSGGAGAGAGAGAAAAGGAAGAAAEPGSLEGARYDEDGILLDTEEQEQEQEQLQQEAASAAGGEVESSLQPSASVRRNLGSALEGAEASDACTGGGGGGGGGMLHAEVQSQLQASGGSASAASAPGVVGGFAMARLASGRGMTLTVQPSTPAVQPLGGSESPGPGSTTQQSSLSAGGDPTAPFTVPPSSARRFAQRGGTAAAEEAAGATGRRWAWRREGGGGGGVAAGGARQAFAAGGGVSAFQRARVDSASKQDGVSGAPAASAASHSSSTEPPSRRGTSEEQQRGAVSGGSGLPPPILAGTDSGLSLPSGSLDAARGSAAPLQDQQLLLQRSMMLRPALSVLEASSLPSPSATLAGVQGTAMVEGMLHELRSLAALESAIYLAGGRKASAGSGGRHLHAPARRLARTILSLGPQEGLSFGLQAICAVQGVAGAGSGDMHRLSFWWSNVLQLRCMFSALCQGLDTQLGPQASQQPVSPTTAATAAYAAAAAAEVSRGAVVNGLEWMQALLPELRELEAWLFGEMVKFLWWRVLLRRVKTAVLRTRSSTSGGGSATASMMGPGIGGSNVNGLSRPSSRSGPAPWATTLSTGTEVKSPSSVQGTPRSFESEEEAALHRWVQGLWAVERVARDPLRPIPAPRAHLALLHRQLISAVLRRLDTLLFRRLLMDEGGDPLSQRLSSMGSGHDAFSRSAEADEVLGSGAEAAAAGLLEPDLLPFPRGPLTFGTGVSLKMAVSRLNSWAADCGVKEERLPQAGRSTEMSDYRLFPCLRATADLLMMPKEVLADPQMRREVVPGLPLHRVCQLLERFQPDENAPDPLLPDLLESLQRESPRSDGASTPSPTAKAEGEYALPDERTLLAEGVIEPMGLEMDEESDEELEALASIHTRSGFSHLSPASSGAAGEHLRAQRFALLRGLWATAQQA